MRVVYSLIWILSIAAHSVVAQEIRNDGVSMSVYFDNGFSSVDHGPDRRELDSLAQRLRALYIDDIISEITVKGWSSPNGLPENNVRLAEARARNTAEYLAMKADIPRSLFKVEGCGIDWSEIEKAAAETTDMPYRDEVLRVLDDDSALRRHNLIHLQEGKPYKYLYARVFPSLRRADISAAVTVEICSTPPRTISPETVENAYTTASSQAETREVAHTADDTARTQNASQTHDETTPTPILRPARMPRPHVTGSRWALKTNLLYDAALIPNIGIEFRFADRWTVSADYMHAWWSNDKKHRYWRCLGGDVALRRYFGNEAFTGHHIGIYGTMLSYDVERSSKKGYQSDGYNYGAGFEYGYSLPVGGRLNIDFSLGVGYFGGRYKEYVPTDDCYVWQKTENLRWFGPTRAEIALVWILGGDRRSTKGGKR